MIKRIHYISGLTIASFVGIHLLNHVLILFGETVHIAFMEATRVVYRHWLIESLLLLAVLTQIISGLRLATGKRKSLIDSYDRWQVYSGGYLSFFLLIHVSAVLVGRYYFTVDTNLYYGAAGLNTYPDWLFFVPYYGLAIVAFFIHVATIHYRKMRQLRSHHDPSRQALVIIMLGVLLAIIILVGMIGITIPSEYQKLGVR
ncbi:hypothetical protein [Tunicatimonas pelagia]|uniref:hypothetical protein n=1 Tax=Tunicatimonas pelagia TaxID=931531 RepID=UPI0026652591|nr:hypothetical protein [Tunicatimonas pelagia]WKN46029.1 hypothetical protein P0M28_13825 [Tunicatimonas pelagia]